ncbi:MAG: hypothetical protein K8F58_04370 [Bauldia sp.]|nr:hypothetical protein [Bauldia sp.]
MESHPSVVPAVGTEQARRELAEFVKSAETLFFDMSTDAELEAAIKSLALSAAVLATADFPDEQIRAIGSEFGFTQEQRERLRFIRLVLRAEHQRIVALQSHDASDEDEDEGEEDESADLDEESPDASDDEEGNENAEKIARFLAEKFTYKPEFISIYFVYLNKNEKIKRLHNRAIRTKETAIDTWEIAKEKIKSVLSMLGIEGAFVAIDYGAQRSPLLKHILKILGTGILPILGLLWAIWTVTRWLANPIQKFINWIAKEFDIKFPVDEDEGVTG